jgi:hypothetical protein
MKENSQAQSNNFYKEMFIETDKFINKNDAFIRIKFSSMEEQTDPETWKSITSDFQEFKKYMIYAIETPEEKPDSGKRYVLVYGQKRLFAATMLGLDRIKARVLSKHTENLLDRNIVTLLYSYDYASMTYYEKGELIEKILREKNMKFEEFAAKTGLPYQSLRAVFSAYNASKSTSKHLYDAYKENRISMRVVNSSRKYYRYGSGDYAKKLTDFLCRYDELGMKYIDFYLKNSSEDIFIRDKVMKAMEAYEVEKKLNSKAKGKYAWINDTFGLKPDETEKMADVINNLCLPKGRKKILYILAADGIIPLEKCSNSFFNGMDKKMLAYLDFYSGQLRECKKNYDNLEKHLCKEFGNTSKTGFQPDFKKACLYPYNITWARTISKEYLPYSSAIEKKGTKASFKRFCKYLSFCTEKKLDPAFVVNLYENDFIRGFFNGFCKYSILFRKSKEKFLDCFQANVI